jgi:hypothetical protein
VVISGGRATICFLSSTESYPPNSTGHVIGEAVVSTDYSLWYSIGSNKFRRLAGPAQSVNDLGTAGALSLFTAPRRLVDTRTGSGFFDAGNHYVNDTLRTYNIITIAAGAVPQKATAILGRITIVNPGSQGVLQESPNPPPGATNDLGMGTALVNFPASGIIAQLGATFVSALDSSGNIRVHVVMGAGSVDVIIDITGFYL